MPTHMMPTRDELARMFPRALPDWLDAMTALAPKLCEFYAFGRSDWCGFAGQVGHECNGLALKGMKEDLRYTSAARVLEVFGYRVGLALKKDEGLRARYPSKAHLARAMVGNPDLLADVVYGGREGTPWMQGSRYPGRGPTQITHLDNYRAIGAEIRRQPGGKSCPDLVADPDALCRDPEWGVRSAFADWHIKGLSRWARQQEWDAVSAALNTGSPHKVSITNGLASRRRWIAKALAIWPDGSEGAPDGQGSPMAAVLTLREGSSGPGVRAAQELLVARGYALGGVDGRFGPLMRRAVVAFQSEHGLPVDGDLDAADMDVLRATAPIALERNDAATVPGSEQVATGSTIAGAGKLATVSVVAETAGNAAGVSPLDVAMGYLGQAGEIVGKITGMGMTLPPKVVTMVVASIAGLTLWTWGNGLVKRRIEKYRSGLDLSR